MTGGRSRWGPGRPKGTPQSCGEQGEPGYEIPKQNMGQVPQCPARRATAFGLQHGQREKMHPLRRNYQRRAGAKGYDGRAEQQGTGCGDTVRNPRLPCPIQWKMRTTRCEAALRPKLRCHLPHNLCTHPAPLHLPSRNAPAPTEEHFQRSRDFLFCRRWTWPICTAIDASWKRAEVSSLHWRCL